MSREAFWVASQVTHFVVDAGAGVGVVSQVARFVVDVGAGVCVYGVAECNAGDVGSVISVVGGVLFSSPSSGDDLPSGVATSAPVTLAQRNPACSWTASLGGGITGCAAGCVAGDVTGGVTGGVVGGVVRDCGGSLGCKEGGVHRGMLYASS